MVALTDSIGLLAASVESMPQSYQCADIKQAFWLKDQVAAFYPAPRQGWRVRCVGVGVRAGALQQVATYRGGARPAFFSDRTIMHLCQCCIRRGTGKRRQGGIGPHLHAKFGPDRVWGVGTGAPKLENWRFSVVFRDVSPLLFSFSFPPSLLFLSIHPLSFSFPSLPFSILLSLPLSITLFLPFLRPCSLPFLPISLNFHSLSFPILHFPFPAFPSFSLFSF